MSYTPPPTEPPTNSSGTPPTNPAMRPAQFSPADERMWATLIHVGGIFFWILPALIGYLTLKDKGPFIRHHTATALNFHVTMTIAYIAGGLLTVVAIGALIIPLVWILTIIFGIMAAIAASRGEYYTYPLAITFVN
jgi:uncharacterized protein